MNRPRHLPANLKKFGSNLLLICLGIIGPLFFLELGLRLIPEEKLEAMTERTSQRLVLYRLDSRVGWTLRPNATSTITTKDNRAIPIQVNSQGLRDSEHSYEKPANTFRVLILGDSFAEAQDLYLEEAFPYLTEKCLNQKLAKSVEVINGGVSGYNTADEYLFYKNEGFKYNPDLVLLVFYVGNDLSGLIHTVEERLVAGFGGYQFTLNNGHLNQKWIDWANPYDGQTSAIELFLRRHSRLWRILAHPESKIYWAYQQQKENLRRWFQPNEAEEAQINILPWQYYLHVKDFSDNPVIPQNVKNVWAVLRAVIQQLQAEVRADRSELAIVVLPADYQVDQDALEHALEEMPFLEEKNFEVEWQIEQPNEAILRAMKQQAIPAFDLFSHFRAHEAAGGAPLYFDGFDQHLNREGHRVMAEAICGWLVDNQALQLPQTSIK